MMTSSDSSPLVAATDYDTKSPGNSEESHTTESMTPEVTPTVSATDQIAEAVDATPTNEAAKPDTDLEAQKLSAKSINEAWRKDFHRTSLCILLFVGTILVLIILARLIAAFFADSTSRQSVITCWTITSLVLIILYFPFLIAVYHDPTVNRDGSPVLVVEVFGMASMGIVTLGGIVLAVFCIVWLLYQIFIGIPSFLPPDKVAEGVSPAEGQ